MTTQSPPHGHRHPKRALLHSAAGEIVLWCPSCKQQIVRTKGQVTLPRLALAEFNHIGKCQGAKTS